MKRFSIQVTNQNIQASKRVRPNDERSISVLERGERRGERPASLREQEEKPSQSSQREDSSESDDLSEEEEETNIRNTWMSRVKIDNARGPYLWSVPHRQREQDSSPAHKRAMRIVQPYVLAFFYSGAAGPEPSIWPEKARACFSGNMSKAWVEITTKLRCIDGTVNGELGLIPTCHEARKLYNAFGAWRWRAIRTIRLLVGALFFAEHGSATERQQVCQNLLNEDRFACMEAACTPPTGRFCAPIISTALVQVFWFSSNGGLALHEFTYGMFDPVPDMAIVFVCVAIRHAIREYESGIQIVSNFEGNSMNESAEIRLRRTWERQSDQRKTVLRAILMQRIKNRVDMDKLKAGWKRKPNHAG